MAIRRVYITGGPGSGKSTLSQKIAAAAGLPLYEMDGVSFAQRWDGEKMAAEAERIAVMDEWVSEGSYLGWTVPLLDRAELIIRLDVTSHVALYRVLARHVKADMAGNNRFPGWRNFFRFWRWVRRYYHNSDLPGLNPWGVPYMDQTARAILEAYAEKVMVCRNNGEVAKVLAERFGVR